MAEIAVDQVAEVIILARELAEAPGRAEAEFDAFVARLNRDEQAELVAIMWIGRGTFDVGDWDEAVQTATDEASTPTQDYLKGTPHLADHLEAGLEALGWSPGDEENALY